MVCEQCGLELFVKEWDEAGKAFVEYPMPADFDRLIRVWADLEPVSHGRWLGKSLILP